MLGIIYDSAKIIKYHGEYYSDNFANHVIERYSAIDSEVMYIMPFLEAESDCNYEKIHYSVIEAPIKIDFSWSSFLHRKKNQQILEKYITQCDKLIIRMPSIAGIMAIKIANEKGINYLVELVGDVWGSLWYHDLRGKVIAPFMYRLVKKSIHFSKNVQYITDEFLQKKYPTNGNRFICPNTSYEREEFQSKIYNCMILKKIRICSIGNVNVRYKGHSTVIKSISNLKKLGYSVKYFIIGGGNQEYINRIIKRHGLEKEVVLLGQLTHRQVYDFLKTIDIYIQPSYTEAQGRSLLEAMNESCPCLCTNVGGMKELIPAHFRFNPGDYKHLTELILSLDDKILGTMSFENWEKSEQYSVENCQLKRTMMYQKVFGGKCEKVNNFDIL